MKSLLIKLKKKKKTKKTVLVLFINLYRDRMALKMFLNFSVPVVLCL